jgi:hypothetical protein
MYQTAVEALNFVVLITILANRVMLFWEIFLSAFVFLTAFLAQSTNVHLRRKSAPMLIKVLQVMAALGHLSVLGT